MGGTNCRSFRNGELSQSDLLQLKRLDGINVKDQPLQPHEVYLGLSPDRSEFFVGSDGQPDWLESANHLHRVYRYHHRVYFVRQSPSGNPALYMLALNRAGMRRAQQLVEGVAAIEYRFGIDLDDDSAIDQYLSADQISAAVWDRSAAAQIIAVQIHLLLSSVSEDRSAPAPARFLMPSGDRTFASDGRRRNKLSTTVMLRNPIFGSGGRR